jgi:TetR/AcrR family transcriptional regulator, regulator of autoinduction and epiphytic fitness
VTAITSTDAPNTQAPGTGAATEARREEILAAALDVFVEHGFKGATIKLLASAAGLRSPALLYWYFPNKEELFRAVLWRYLPVLEEEQLQDRAEAFDLPPDQFLGAVMRRVLERFADPSTRKAFWLLVREHGLLERVGFSMRAARPTNVVTFVVDYLNEQIARGTLRPHDPHAVARVVVAQLNLSLQMRVVNMGLLADAPDDETLIAQTLDIVMRGILARDS